LKPILIFPKPAVSKKAPGNSFVPNKRHLPSHARQKERMDADFTLLENNFNNGLLSVDPDGSAPERMLVFETADSVKNFKKAISKINGLEFINDMLGDVIEPDGDFYELDKKGKHLGQSSYIYLTMSNQKALKKIKDYWDKYKDDETFPFPTGFAPLGYLFDQLKTIRFWDTHDRLYKTGIIENWEERIAEGQDVVPVEIELWFSSNAEVRAEKEARVRKLVKILNGKILTKCTIDEIRYQSILVSIQANSIAQFIKDNKSDIELLRCDDVMFFRPTGQCVTPVNLHDEEQESIDDTILNSDVDINDEPIIALLDGLPLANHTWIKDSIYIDDPDGWSTAYKPKDQVHGTGMASLIIRGDYLLDKPTVPRKLYCRPILKPEMTISNKTVERIPEDVLPIDLVHRAVRRMFEPENGVVEAPTIKVISLSVADPNRLFEYQMSPWAKLLDYLSEKYQVLFVISAGNHPDDLDLGVTNEEFNKRTSVEKESLILKSISDKTHLRRLMSPAESINALTIGAYHHDENADDEFYGQINPYSDRNMPSTINPITWGRKRSIKPELLMPGGRVTYQLKGYSDSDPAILKVIPSERPPGNKVASPGNSGSLNSFVYTAGTSNSAALASRRLCFLYDTIQDLYLSKYGHVLSSKYEAVLLKAMLCHGASLPNSYQNLVDNLKNQSNSRTFKSLAAKYLGFGNVNEDRIHGCIDEQATILQCGEIKNDDSHVYKFTLPESLSAKSNLRRLIITLAWFSPINNQSSIYREAHLSFTPITGKNENNHLEIQKRESDHHMVKNGTVQHEVLSGDRASPYAVGTNLEIIVDCKTQTGSSDISIPYGLVVTLDVPDSKLPIYEEVKAGLEIEFKAKVAPTAPLVP